MSILSRLALLPDSDPPTVGGSLRSPHLKPKSNYRPITDVSRVHNRDGCCRITESRDLVENAHIILRSERDWFIREGMDMYNSATDLPLDHITDDIKNGFLLRRDLHYAFDSSLFCLAVKEGKVVVHFLRRTYEVGAYYRNVEFRLPAGETALEFIWARFAWIVIPLIAKFASSGNRLVKLADGQTRRVGTKVPNTGDASTTTSAAMESAPRGTGSATSTRSHKRKKNRPNTDCPDIVIDHAARVGIAIPRHPNMVTHDTGIVAVRNSLDDNHEYPSDTSTPPSTGSPTPLTPTQTCDSAPVAVSQQERELDGQKQQHFFPLMSMLHPSCILRLLNIGCSRGHNVVKLIHVANCAVVSRPGSYAAC